MKRLMFSVTVLIAALGLAAGLSWAAQGSASADQSAGRAPQVEVGDERPGVKSRTNRPTDQDSNAVADDREAARGGRDSGRFQPRRWAQEFENQFSEDLTWLRQRGLERYADRLEEARKSEEAGSRTMVMSAHIRIRQLRRLWQERPEEAQRAVEEMRLGLQILDLAAAVRAAEGADKDRLAQELQQALTRQFEARLAAQRSFLAAMERRMEKLRQDVSRQEELKSQIVEQRHRDLLDVNQPLPEPSLLLPGHSGPAGSPGDGGDNPPPPSGRRGGHGGEEGQKPPPPPPPPPPAERP